MNTGKISSILALVSFVSVEVLAGESTAAKLVIIPVALPVVPKSPC